MTGVFTLDSTVLLLLLRPEVWILLSGGLQVITKVTQTSGNLRQLLSLSWLV